MSKSDWTVPHHRAYSYTTKPVNVYSIKGHDYSMYSVVRSVFKMCWALTFSGKQSLNAKKWQEYKEYKNTKLNACPNQKGVAAAGSQ